MAEMKVAGRLTKRDIVFLAATGCVVFMLSKVLPHRHGQPIAAYGLGAVCAEAFGVFCLWGVVRSGHESSIRPGMKFPLVVWLISLALGAAVMSYSEALAFQAAWYGWAWPRLAGPALLFGFGLWLVGCGVLAVAAIRSKRRSGTA